MGAALTHQVRQIVHIVCTQLFSGDGLLLLAEVLGVQDVFHPPLVAACSRQDAAHQVVAAVCMVKAVQGVLLVHTKGAAGDEHGTGGSQRDVALAVAHSAAANSSGSIVAGAGADLNAFRQTQLGSSFGGQGANRLPAFKQLGHLGFANAADIQHFFAPALVLHIQQQHAGSIGVIGAVYAGQLVVDVVLRQHDLADLCKVLRLGIAHPQQFGGGKAGKCNVCGVLAQVFFANDVVQVFYLLLGAAVIPQNAGADHFVLCIQHHQAVHLAAGTNTGHLRSIKAVQQLRNACTDSVPPVSGVLLAPARMRECNGIFAAYNVGDLPVALHQQQLDCRGTQIDTNVVHEPFSFALCFFLRFPPLFLYFTEFPLASARKSV